LATDKPPRSVGTTRQPAATLPPNAETSTKTSVNTATSTHWRWWKSLMFCGICNATNRLDYLFDITWQRYIDNIDISVRYVDVVAFLLTLHGLNIPKNVTRHIPKALLHVRLLVTNEQTSLRN
jgi:hypothetical protein